MNRAEKAAEYQSKGQNCAQATLCAFLDKTNLDFETAVKLTEGFGGGFGGKREVCGVVSALTMLASLESSSGDTENAYTKKETYSKVSKLIDKFEEEHGSIICRELVGMSGNINIKPCSEYVKRGVELIARELYGEK